MGSTTEFAKATNDPAPLRHRFPWMAWAILIFVSGWAVMGLAAAANSQADGLSGLLQLLSLPVAAYAGLDRFVISRGQPVSKKPWLTRVAALLFVIAIAGVLVGLFRTRVQPHPGDASSHRAEIPTEGAFIPAAGKPYQLWLPRGWQQRETRVLHCDIATGNNDDSASVMLAIVPLVDLPPDLRDPDSVAEQLIRGVAAAEVDPILWTVGGPI